MYYDQNFLSQLDKERNKTIYARITKLTFNELPIERIEGQVTTGSINIDGQSSLRRTCSLTLIAQDFQQIDFYCGLNTKFKLEIGIKNNINTNYPDIIWFNQGIYLITQFNSSRSASSYTLSISGKDKMCLLNGEVGGSIESSVDFGQIEEEDIYGNWIIRKIPVKDIIRNIVHIYGKEPHHNIIINDLEDYGVELMEYRYDTNLYLYRETGSDTYKNATFQDLPCVYANGNQGNTSFSQLKPNEYESLNDLTSTSKRPIKLADNKTYYVTKIQAGETCGYRLTDLTFPGDLISKAGESITSILDKIKNMLVEFEYFYNTDGQFIFQKKPSTLSVMQNLNPEEENSINFQSLIADNVYTFNNGELLISINNNPNLLNLKNDYSIWGERTTMSGAAVPIHLRYAIDKKPTKYTSISVNYGTYSKDENNKDVFTPGSDYEEITEYISKHNITLTGQDSKTYISGTSWSTQGTNQTCDWREVVYRMALDYYKYGFLKNFQQRVAQANQAHGLYTNGITGYESYYIDIYSFWRDLYYPIEDDVNRLNAAKSVFEAQVSILKNKKETLETQIQTCQKSMEGYDDKTSDAYKELRNKLADYQQELAITEEQIIYTEGKLEEIVLNIEHLEVDKDNYYMSGNQICWNKYVYEQPYNLNFWFDFLDSNGVLSQYQVKNIGNRQKVVTDTKVKAITYNKIPNVIYHKRLDTIISKDGYMHVQVGSHYDNMFSISSQGKSTQDKLHELINAHSFCIESVTINTIPIYYLEPNTRISVVDKDRNMSDIYQVNKITIPLNYNGVMSINANKIYDSLI